MGMISAVGLKIRVQYCHEEMTLLSSTHLLSWQLCNRAKIMNSSFGGNYLDVLTFCLLFCQEKSKSLSGSRTNQIITLILGFEKVLLVVIMDCFRKRIGIIKSLVWFQSVRIDYQLDEAW